MPHVLKIRREQIAAFREQARREFEDRTLEHVRSLFREECTILGEEATRERIRKGVEAAGGYGLELEYDVVRYIDLMFIFSPDFDTDAAWAGPILHDETTEPRAKMDRLYEEAREHL